MLQESGPMLSKPKLLFVYDHPHPDRWMDGLSAALDVLEEDFEIERYNLQTYTTGTMDFNDYDFVLGWGAFGSRVDKIIQSRPTSGNARNVICGLCIAGNATPTDGADKYDVLFYETDWVNQFYLPDHPNVRKAFGINSDLFCKPTIPMPIVWDYIGVGSFATWKRWEKMADKPGCKLVVGEYQLNNEPESLGIVRHLVANDVMVSNQVHPLDLVNLYYWSRKLYIPADVYGGGERALLEARACGLQVEIEEDNPKLKELLTIDIPDHHIYAEQLKTGIMTCLGKGHEEGTNV